MMKSLSKAEFNWDPCPDCVVTECSYSVVCNKDVPVYIIFIMCTCVHIYTLHLPVCVSLNFCICVTSHKLLI